MGNQHKALQLLRKFHGLKQTDLAPKLQISRGYLSAIEAGLNPIRYPLLKKYALVFNIAVWNLVFLIENMDTPREKLSRAREHLPEIVNRILDYTN